MSFMMNHDWSFPVPIRYGPGRIAEIAKYCQLSGMSNPLIITDRQSKELPFIHLIRQSIESAGMRHSFFYEISPNPQDKEVSLGKIFFNQGEHDGVVAVGGGSGMDAGKAVALISNNDADIWDFDTQKDPIHLPTGVELPPLITVPTTAGTGAETESTAMITDTKRLMKWCIWHPNLKPNFAILDPELIVGLPSNLTAWTGVDAMVHAIEAYCVPETNPLCDGLALESLRLISKNLHASYTEPLNLSARGGMLVGSCLAGVAFLKGLGLVHALSHAIGAEFDTQHGLTNAVILPSVLKINAKSIENKIGAMSFAMGLRRHTFSSFYDAICEILDELNIPKTLLDIGVSDDCVSRIAKKALEDSAAQTNPCILTSSEIENVLKLAIFKGR